MARNPACSGYIENSTPMEEEVTAAVVGAGDVNGNNIVSARCKKFCTIFDSKRASSSTHREATAASTVFFTSVSAVIDDGYHTWMRQHPPALAKGKKIALISDCDGTLSPIIQDPDRAFMFDLVSSADSFSQTTEALHLYPSNGGWGEERRSMPSIEILSLKDRISEIKNRYFQMKRREIGEVRDIWSSIMRLRKDVCLYRKNYLVVEILISEFNSLLRFFIGNEMLLKDSSDFSFKEDCRQLLRQVNVYTDLEGAWSSANSIGHARSNGGVCPLGDLSHPSLGGNRMSEQVVKLKSYDKFAQWATASFLAILIGLTAVNSKQAQFLFRSCSSLVFAATISGIGMLLLVSVGHSSPRVVRSLKMLQYLIIGLLFITVTHVYIFTLE